MWRWWQKALEYSSLDVSNPSSDEYNGKRCYGLYVPLKYSGTSLQR